jgi:competence ComEA-like helix-hairpin-helix protein
MIQRFRKTPDLNSSPFNHSIINHSSFPLVVCQRITQWRRGAKFKARILFCLALLLVALCAAAQSKKPLPEEPLDLNAATVEELQTLPTVGPAAAKAIVRFREKSGPFRKVEDLLAVRGFTQKRLKTLRPYITVVPPTPKS